MNHSQERRSIYLAAIKLMARASMTASLEAGPIVIGNGMSNALMYLRLDDKG
jgi:hypothetical protein